MPSNTKVSKYVIWKYITKKNIDFVAENRTAHIWDVGHVTDTFYRFYVIIYSYYIWKFRFKNIQNNNLNIDGFIIFIFFATYKCNHTS